MGKALKHRQQHESLLSAMSTARLTAVQRALAHLAPAQPARGAQLHDCCSAATARAGGRMKRVVIVGVCQHCPAHAPSLIIFARTVPGRTCASMPVCSGCAHAGCDCVRVCVRVCASSVLRVCSGALPARVVVCWGRGAGRRSDSLPRIDTGMTQEVAHQNPVPSTSHDFDTSRGATAVAPPHPLPL